MWAVSRLDVEIIMWSLADTYQLHFVQKCLMDQKRAMDAEIEELQKLDLTR